MKQGISAPNSCAPQGAHHSAQRPSTFLLQRTLREAKHVKDSGDTQAYIKALHQAAQYDTHHRHLALVLSQVSEALWAHILKGQLPQVDACLLGHGVKAILLNGLQSLGVGG